MTGEVSGRPAAETVRRTTVVRNEKGLHARAAAKFVTLATTFDAVITVNKGGQTVSGSSILGLMMLAAGPDSEIELAATGPEAEKGIAALVALVENKFEEDGDGGKSGSD